MLSSPSSQRKIYGLDDVFNKIIKLINDKKLPNRILIKGPSGIGKCTMAYHIINYIFSSNEENKYDLENNIIDTNNQSFKLINNNSHPNFHLIKLMVDKKNIEISQIRKMIDFTNKSAFNNKPRFILIDNAENLNKNSLNSLLKITEEQNENIYFILIHNINKKILNTLSSRFLSFNINLTYDESIIITNKILNKNIHDLVNSDLINHYYSPGDFLNLINFSNEFKIDLNKLNLKDFLIFLIDNNLYKKSIFIKSFIFTFIEFYFLKILTSSINKNKISSYYSFFLNKFNYCDKFNLDYESLFMEFKSKILNG